MELAVKAWHKLLPPPRSQLPRQERSSQKCSPQVFYRKSGCWRVCARVSAPVGERRDAVGWLECAAAR